MPDIPVNLSEGLPETVLAPAPGDLDARLAAALGTPGDGRRAAVAALVRDDPRFLAGWSALGEMAADPVEGYAYFRVGYHRGLDALRASGWRGTGVVRWRHPSNRGFLRALEGLRASAGAIGEADEEERCAVFLRQLDPEWERRESPA
ncbi:MAG: DUF3151 family protein [Acidimicrobiales bacterium]